MYPDIHARFPYLLFVYIGILAGFARLCSKMYKNKWENRHNIVEFMLEICDNVTTTMRDTADRESEEVRK